MERTDVEPAGRFLYEAFVTGAERRGFAPRLQGEREAIAWTWSMLRLQPNEILVAEADDQLAGFLALSPRGRCAGIGPLAIHPRFQGRGVARRLMEAGVAASAGVESFRAIQEAFNPTSFALIYTSFDFDPVGDILDLYSPLDAGCGGTSPAITSAAKADLDEICAFDEPRSTFRRRPDYAHFFSWGRVLVYRDRGSIQGVLACLPGAKSVQLGPFIAEGPDVALALLRHGQSLYPGRTCFARVLARDRQVAATLLRSGWKLYCLGLLVVRGTWRPGPSVEGFSVFPEGI